MHNYNKLRVYAEAMDLAELIYEAAAAFPTEERYNLSDQLRRCAVSIPSNLAEGCGRATAKDTARFIDMAIGSAFEADTQLGLASRLGMADTADLRSRVGSVSRQLAAFRDRVLRDAR